MRNVRIKMSIERGIKAKAIMPRKLLIFFLAQYNFAFSFKKSGTFFLEELP